jgi:aminopeptidase N
LKFEKKLALSPKLHCRQNKKFLALPNPTQLNPKLILYFTATICFLMKPAINFLSVALFSTLFLSLCPMPSKAQSSTGPAIQPGVSAELAACRAPLLHDISYNLVFSVPVELTAPIITKEELQFNLSANKDLLQIDFKQNGHNIDTLVVNGKAVPAVLKKEHIIIQPRYLHLGANTVSLHFVSINPPVNRNSDFMYTLLVPDRARTLFPCFDQPNCKAVFNLTLTVPKGWKAMGNAPLKDSIASGGYQTLQFLPSDKISTYLFAFVAGRFAQADTTLNGRVMHFYYRETDSAKILLSIPPVFAIVSDALQFMQQYTGVAYPFQKLDFAAIPDFQFGGMEHAGGIQYNAGALFLDAGATRDQLISRSNLLAHEVAHMWFGDLVTMAWFNDVWMKEVFANFMADKIGNITLQDGKYNLKFLTSHFPAAYSTDRTLGANPIRQQLGNLQEAGTLYGNIIYHKAPIMVMQLEKMVGEAAFQAGLQEYIKTYAGRNATWPDLIAILQKHTSANLLAWNKVWVNEPGRPAFSYRLKEAHGNIISLEISQQGEDGTPRVWPQVFTVSLVYKDHVEELPVDMTGAALHLTAAVGRPSPDCILFNADGRGYGIFPVDKRSLGWLAKADSPVMRAAGYINLYENMLDGRAITPRGLLAFDRSAIENEPEELNLNILVDQLNSIFWRFIPVASRDSIAASLEASIWEAMQKAATGNEKKLLFKAYGNIALSTKAMDTLYSVWKKQQPPSGVKLSEDDYTGLAAALSLRNYPGSPSILNEQLARIQNKDRRQRLQFLMPALSADMQVRDSFFAALKDAAARKKEAWVVTGLGYLHHPLRAAASEKYLPQTLNLLEEVQRTGDVFFPNNWLQASLGWYRTPSAAAVVRGFLKAHPGYNAKLKAKILQASDNLFRAEKLGR